jgi:hypothetical protein
MFMTTGMRFCYTGGFAFRYIGMAQIEAKTIDDSVLVITIRTIHDTPEYSVKLRK